MGISESYFLTSTPVATKTDKQNNNK